MGWDGGAVDARLMAELILQPVRHPSRNPRGAVTFSPWVFRDKMKSFKTSSSAHAEKTVYLPNPDAPRPASPLLQFSLRVEQRLIDIRQMPTPRQHWAIGPNVTFPDDTDHNLVGSAMIVRPPTPSTPPNVGKKNVSMEASDASLPTW